MDYGHALLPHKLVCHQGKSRADFAHLTFVSLFHALGFNDGTLPKLVVHGSKALQFLHDCAVQMVQKLLSLDQLPLFYLLESIAKDT